MTINLSSIPPEQLSLLVDTLSSTAHTVLQTFAHDSDLPTNWKTLISFRLQDVDLFHIQRTGCDEAVIFVNGYEFVSLDKTDKPRIAKFRFAANKAIKLATLLSKTGSALVTGDLAYAITKERKRLRRTVMSYGYNALDDRYFNLSGSITLTDRLSGRTLTTELFASLPLEPQVYALKHALSILMLQDTETEELVDLLESSRSQQVNARGTEEPSSYTISSNESGSLHTHLEYRNTSTHLLPTQSEN
jgi:hypothetical protein